MAAERRVGAVSGELDELELVRDLQLARQVREEDDAGLERRDQERLALAVVLVDLLGQLGYPVRDLLRGEVAVTDARSVG